MEFPVLFLGAMAEDIPALYSLMNYADIELGTWYPRGGMYEIVDAMHNLALELGVNFSFDAEVQNIIVEGSVVTGLKVLDRRENILFNVDTDVVIGSADYHFIESQLLPASARSYNEDYWNKG